MSSLISLAEAAEELALDPSRVRALIVDGALRGEKVGGRWLVARDSVADRLRSPVPPGRPLAARNAWALLLLASGEPVPVDLDPSTRWRLNQALIHQGLVAMRGRFERRAAVHRLWALPGELRALNGDPVLVRTGSSAAGALKLPLAAPDAVDAYVPESRLDGLRSEYGLEDGGPVAESNVTLRAVHVEAWLLDGRRVVPKAAAALDLASYADARSARVGAELLAELDHGAATR
jgi:excisionase family DNA binding protein